MIYLVNLEIILKVMEYSYPPVSILEYYESQEISDDDQFLILSEDPEVPITSVNLILFPDLN